MMSDKIFRRLATVVICSLLLTAGCAPTVALKFTPQDSTTYKLTIEAQRSIKWEGPVPDKTVFQGGQTGNKIEMTFTRQIQSVDDKGNAVAEITIEGLKYLSIVRDNTVLDFDSSREKDKNNPMAGLIGQSYTIEIAPTGKVTEVIDVKQAQAALKGSSSANKAALTVLEPDAIKRRHGTLALPDADKNQLRIGDNWSSIRTFSFGMMGSKSYERIYTLKKIEGWFKQRAIVDMNSIPTSGTAEQLDKEGISGFSKMFDNTETYTGELRLDLTAGKVEKYLEKLQSEWIAVDPAAGQEDDKEPAALKMTAIRLYRLDKID
ncbi:hypothetical protein ES703_67889 [subsurface metagenome]